MHTDTIQTKREIWQLSRYIGTIYAKWVTVVLLIPVLFSLAPSSEYLILLALLLPAFLQAVSQNRKDHADIAPVLLLTCTKYHFSNTKYQAEKNAYPLILLFLCIWQYRLMQTELFPALRIYPGIIIIINILCRLVATGLFRLHLHHQFTQFHMLDDL